jgi:hypothetical protein
MALPGTNAISVIKVEADDALVGIAPLTTAPVITEPTDNENIVIAWDEDIKTENVTFDWTDSEAVGTYEIEISADSGFPMMNTLLISGVAGLTYDLYAYFLPIDKNLFIRVRSINIFAASPWSEVITFSVTKEVLKEGLERVELTTDSGTEKQYLQAVNDPEDGKKNVTIKGLMKLKVAVNEDDEPTEYTTFLQDGDIWYDSTDE